jgi:hypothetical protein
MDYGWIARASFNTSFFNIALQGEEELFIGPKNSIPVASG